jgi:dihydrofolate reductase
MRAILAINNLGFIGIDDKLLWYNTDDLKHFKSLTEGSTLLVGYRTAQSLPPLKNRQLITDNREGFNFEPEWCIGGKKTYEKYAPYFTELHISHIDNNFIGNVIIPDLTRLNPECRIFNYYF